MTNIEIPTQAPEATRGTPAQLTDQSPQLFSDSMLAASKVSSDAVAGQTVGLDIAAHSNEAELASGQSRMPQSSGVQSKHAQSGGDSQKTQAKLASSRVQNKDIPVAHTSNDFQCVAANPVIKGVLYSFPNVNPKQPPSATPGASLELAPKTVLGATPNSVPKGTRESFAGPDRNVRPDSAPNAFQSVVENPATKGVLYSFPSADRKAFLSDALHASSGSAQMKVQSVAGNPVPNGMQELPSSADLNELPFAAPKTSSSAVSNIVSGAALDAAPVAMQGSLPNTDLRSMTSTPSNAVLNVATNAVPNGMRELLSTADLNGLSITSLDASSNASPNAVQSAGVTAASTGMRDSIPNADLSGPSNAAPNLFESTSQNVGHNWLQNSFLKAVLKAFASAGSNALPNAAPNARAGIVPNHGQDAVLSVAHNVAPNPDQNAAPQAVLNPTSGPQLNTEHFPALHASASSTKGGVATLTRDLSADQTIPLATSTDRTTVIASFIVPSIAVDQFASPAQFSSGSLLECQAGISGVNPASATKPSNVSTTNGKNEIKNSSDDATSLKPHTSPASSQPELQKDGQETAPSGDHGQNASVSQDQDPMRSEVKSANHVVAVVGTGQAIVQPSPVQNSAMVASATAHTAKTSDNAPAPWTAVAQALPVINSAKLIQSMGQTEMRVGMRSTEFGNISISTSSTRDLISAQISLDHGELARTLATHLPEMQAKLGGNLPMEVRIDMNGASAGQTGTPGGMDNGSADQSRGGRHQAGNPNSSFSSTHLGGQQLSSAAAMATSDSGFNARLDIRV